MFKQRLLTTLVLIPLVVLFICYANSTAVMVISFVIALLCGMEWMALIPMKNRAYQTVGLILLLLVCYFIHPLAGGYFVAWLLAWLGIAIAVIAYPRLEKIWGQPFVVGVFAILLLSFFADSLRLVFALESGRSLLVYLLCLVWASDIGAYLAGKKAGRHRLIPAVSPGKTWEGLLGGLLLSQLVAVLGYFIFHIQQITIWFLMALVVFLIALLGDLLISMLKRRVQIKDTGNILPGHGGILDRLDSLIAATPLFYYGLTLFAHIANGQ